MPSKILRRSGNAVAEYLRLIEWNPQSLYQVGVGIFHEETTVFREHWPDIAIYGFEPNPRTYNSIKGNYPGRLYPYAISDHPHVAMLHSRKRWKDGSSLYQDKKNEYDIKDKVESTTLDRMLPLLQPHNREGVLWLDCEGSELDALLGGIDFLDKGISVVNVELTGIPRGEGWCKPIQVHDFLSTKGFVQTWTHSHRTSIFQFDAIYLRRELFKPEFCNCMETQRLMRG